MLMSESVLGLKVKPINLDFADLNAVFVICYCATVPNSYGFHTLQN